MSHPTRRAVLAGLAAGLAAPALAQADPWSAVADSARALPQLHSLVVAVDGETVLAEAFRGPGLDAPANVKSVSKSIVALLLGAAIDRGVVPSVVATLGVAAALAPPESAEQAPPPAPAQAPLAVQPPVNLPRADRGGRSATGDDDRRRGRRDRDVGRPRQPEQPQQPAQPAQPAAPQTSAS